MDIHQAVPIQAFVASKQQRTLGVLPESVSHPVTTLLHSFMEEGIPDNTVPPWSSSALGEAIRNRTHGSACPPYMISLSEESYSSGFRMDLASSFLQITMYKFLERISSSLALQQSLRISNIRA